MRSLPDAIPLSKVPTTLPGAWRSSSASSARPPDCIPSLLQTRPPRSRRNASADRRPCALCGGAAIWSRRSSRVDSPSSVLLGNCLATPRGTGPAILPPAWFAACRRRRACNFVVGRRLERRRAACGRWWHRRDYRQGHLRNLRWRRAQSG